MTEKKRELIKTIAVIPSNLEHIAKTGIINGTLLVEIERVMEAYVAQQFKIHKPDVNLEYWQKWLTEHGYQIEFDDDGLWAEDWVQEHKWVDIFDLMMQFAIEQQSKMPTEDKRRLCEIYFSDFNELSDWLLDAQEEGAIAISVFKENGNWILVYSEQYDNPID